MGSSKPSLKSQDKEGFLRAFTDEWAEIEAVHGVKLEYVIEPAGRKGILRLALTALSPLEGHTGLAKAHYQCEYPTAAVESVEACLYRCAVRLERVLRDKYVYPLGKA